MAGVRRKDRKKTSAKSKRDLSVQSKENVPRLVNPQLPWPFSNSRGNKVLRELDVTELQWSAEDERELNQEIVQVNRLNQPTDPEVAGQQSHQFVVSHWGKTTCLVEKVSPGCTRAGNSSNKRRCRKVGTRNKQEYNAFDHKDTDVTNYWMALSDEIILAVFKFLPKKSIIKCARVCKHWRRLAYDESLWLCVDMSNVKNGLGPGVLGRVLKRGTRILRLAQAEVQFPFYDDSPLCFSDVVPLSPKSASDSMFNLRYLDASSCVFHGDTDLLCLVLHSKELTHISLEFSHVSASVLRAISSLQNLEVLNLAMCKGLSPSGMCSLVKGCTQVKQVNLAWTNLSRNTILHILKHLPEIQQLNLSGHRETINDDTVQVLVRSCPNLTHLDLSDCVLLTARSLEEILKLQHLVHLSLSRCYNVAPATFSSFAQMKALAKLDIFGLLNTDGVEVLKKELPNIAVNSSMLSPIARPVGLVYRGNIWGFKCKD